MKTTIQFFMAIVASVIAGVFSADALTVDNVAGNLHAAIGEDAQTAASLTVTGTVDVRDFEFISDKMPLLTSLNLAGARVVAYEGEPTALGSTESPADELPECALMCINLKQVVLPETLTAIADGALGASGIETVEIPAGVKSLGASAFGNCRSLKSIVVPASVESMGQNVFKGCVALETAVVEASIKELPASTFMGCKALKKVVLPESLVSIGNSAFAGCVTLDDCNFPSTLTAIAEKAFAGTALTSANFEHTALKSIGDWAFADCRDLGVVEFAPGVQSIGKGAFYNDASMSVTAMPQELTEIKDFSLRGVGNVAENALADTKIENIGDFALANWSGMQAFVLPSSLKNLGNGAMANWSDVQTINGSTLSHVPALGADVWRGVAQGDVTLIVPDDLESQFKVADQWKEFNVQSKNSTTDQMEILTGLKDDITVSFKGLSLIIESDYKIAGVQLFDVQGRSFILPAHAESHRVVVDTSAWSGAVLIVRVALADGNAAAFKLSRSVKL